MKDKLKERQERIRKNWKTGKAGKTFSDEMARKGISPSDVEFILRVTWNHGFHHGFNTAQEPEFQPIKEGDGRVPFMP